MVSELLLLRISDDNLISFEGYPNASHPPHLWIFELQNKVNELCSVCAQLCCTFYILYSTRSPHFKGNEESILFPSSSNLRSSIRNSLDKLCWFALNYDVYLLSLPFYPFTVFRNVDHLNDNPPSHLRFWTVLGDVLVSYSNNWT